MLFVVLLFRRDFFQFIGTRERKRHLIPFHLHARNSSLRLRNLVKLSPGKKKEWNNKHYHRRTNLCQSLIEHSHILDCVEYVYPKPSQSKKTIKIFLSLTDNDHDSIVLR